MDGFVDRQALQDIADAIREKNGRSDTYKPSEMADAILDLSGSINLQDKQVSITENGTQIITADDGYEGLSSVEVSSEVYEGLNLMALGATQENQNLVNDYIKQNIQENWNPTSILKAGFYLNENIDMSNLSVDFSNTTKHIGARVFLCPNYDFSKCKKGAWARDTFAKATILKMKPYFNLTSNLVRLLAIFSQAIIIDVPNELIFDVGNLTSNQSTFEFQGIAYYDKVFDKFSIVGNRCWSISSKAYCREFECLNSDNVTYIGGIITQQTKKVKLGSVKKVTSFNASNGEDYMLEELYFTQYKATNFNIAYPLLIPLSIRYIIWHALNGDNTLGFENEGATSRTLKLHATPYASWEEWKTTKPSVEDCKFLGVDETEITKYGELTWEDIALSIKLITIGA